MKVLYGVTGSGKTEVYMELIARLLSEGKQSLVLVPEVTLTEQIVRVSKRGLPVGVLHSQCKDSEKLTFGTDVCRRQGFNRIDLMGSHKVGAIVVDEEHDVSISNKKVWLFGA